MRWRVRYVDANGEPRARNFARKDDAEAFDVQARARLAPETQVDQPARNIAFKEYSTRWRLSRETGWAVETRERVESNLRVHLVPAFGNSPMRSITLTEVLEWLARQLGEGKAKSSIKLYFELLDAICAAAIADKVMPDNPCAGVRLSKVLNGVSRAPKWIPTEDQVVRLLDVVPPRWEAAVWLGAGAGLRPSEAIGVEEGERCFDFAVGGAPRCSATAVLASDAWRLLPQRAEVGLVGDGRPGRGRRGEGAEAHRGFPAGGAGDARRYVR
ncbi:hypothetical protein ABT297_19680 [Dactylosporangium sp. NPDC000555]|uniref:phage integrase central domain-containing protein n=1 Tax=Dactylosporangium sp. NPDC000555 TaxID=3154260 RepID=UPI0033238897